MEGKNKRSEETVEEASMRLLVENAEWDWSDGKQGTKFFCTVKDLEGVQGVRHFFTWFQSHPKVSVKGKGEGKKGAETPRARAWNVWRPASSN